MLEQLEVPRRGTIGEDALQVKAKNGSRRLLSLLRKYHGVVVDNDPKPVELIPLAPEPVEINETVVARKPVQKRELPPPKKPWFHVVEAGEQRILISDIIAACASHYGVKVVDIISARRTAKVIRPRQVGYYLSRALTPKSLVEIGRRFGGRDHTAALWGARKIERLRKVDPQLEADLQAIAAAVGGSLA